MHNLKERLIPYFPCFMEKIGWLNLNNKYCKKKRSETKKVYVGLD